MVEDEEIKEEETPQSSDKEEVEEEPLIKSKSKLTDEIRKKQRHVLVAAGKPKLRKSITVQSLAKKLGFKIIETENKPFYFPTYKNQLHVKSFDDLKREVLSIREPVVIDSITKPYQDIMAITRWQDTKIITNSMQEMISHIAQYGGLIVAHGEIKNIIRDEIGEGGEKDSEPEVEFKVVGNQSWLYRTTGLVIFGKHALTSKGRLLFDGNFIPRKVYDFEVIRGDNGEPIISGKGFDYLIYLLGNSMEMLIQKGCK